MPRRNGGALVGAAIPTYFGSIVGVNSQGVRATATARTMAGNLTRCLLPWAVADRWADATDELVNVLTYANDGAHLLLGDPIQGWSPNDLYQDALATPPGLDYYVPPSSPGHTGWTLERDYGRQLVLKDGGMGQFSAGWANRIDLPDSNGSDEYRADIKGCNGAEIGIAAAGQDCAGYPKSGTTLDEAKAGCLGVSGGLSAGPTDQGVEGGGPGGLGLTEQDPGARWDPNVINSDGRRGAIVDSSGEPNMSSPRIRGVAVFDIAHYMANPSCVSQAGTGCVIKVANILGFFVEGMCDTVRSAKRLDPGVNCGSNPSKEVVGRLVTRPASYSSGVGSVAQDATFLKVVRLVR
jgi:hypothetical protein